MALGRRVSQPAAQPPRPLPGPVTARGDLVPTEDPTAAGGLRLPVSGEAFTRRAITVITATIVAMTFAFSLGNVTQLCLDLGITAWIAWLVGPAVDLSVVGLLAGIRFLSLHGYDDQQLTRPRRLLRLCGLLTLALNTAGALATSSTGPPWPTRSARCC